MLDLGHEFSAYPSLVDTSPGNLYAAFAYDAYNNVKLYLNRSTMAASPGAGIG